MTRRSQTKARSFLAIAVCAALLVSEEAAACSCSGLSVEREFQVSELVFEAVVIRGNEEQADQDPEFEVQKVWKGSPPGRMTVPSDKSNCAVFVQTGERRLLFLERVAGQFTIHLCMRHPLVGSEQYREAVAWLSQRAGGADGGARARP